MSDDFEDLLGPAPEQPAKQKAPAKKPAAKPVALARGDAAIVQALFQPVSITFLAEVLQRDRKTITKKLANLGPMARHRGGTPLYDFRQALEYLITPKMNAAEAIKKMGTDDLPQSLQKDVWDAKLKQQKWAAQAGDLWKTEDVLMVLGETFQRLKTTTQLWIDQVSEAHSLPTEVRAELTTMVDALQLDLHRSLVEMPQERSTLSQLGEIEGTELDDF